MGDASVVVGRALDREAVAGVERHDRFLRREIGARRALRAPGVQRTGMCLMPPMKFERSRWGSPVSSMPSMRLRISRKMMRMRLPWRGGL